MIAPFQRSKVALKFQLSDKTLFTKSLTVDAREVGLAEGCVPVDGVEPPQEVLDAGCAGYLIRSLPVKGPQHTLRLTGRFICYVPAQYRRYYVDLRQSFDSYTQKFASKTRSTIRRKIRKFEQRPDRKTTWRSYRSVAEVNQFYDLARSVSAKTYQEKLLDAGLPESEAFRQEMQTLAAQDSVRAYLLFDGDKPVAYLYCPARNGVLLYEYLGYDPEYMKWSVGTILHWHALEDILNEGRFQLFDFTEGESDHKRLFATDSIECANVYFLRTTVGHALLVCAHLMVNTFSRWAGDVMERLGLKARIKKLLRFGR